MTISEFYSMEFKKQLAYVNDLATSTPLSEVARMIGFSQSTMSNHFNENGYEFNRTTKQYEPKIEGKKTQEKGAESMGDLEKYLPILIALAEERMQERERGINFNMLANIPQDNSVRTINISKTLWDKVEKVSKKYPMFKKQDLIALAFMEFVDKYGKE